MKRLFRALSISLLLVTTAFAQFDAPSVRDYPANVSYDGRFTFVRLRWRNDGGRSRGFWSSAWNHDYPRAEQHLSQIIRELTYLNVRLDGSRILTLDDPDLFKYPIAFMWEPGFWVMTLTMAVGVSLVGVMVGNLWSIVIESLRLNSWHISFRMGRIPWRHHWVVLFVWGFLIFGLLALIRSRGNLRDQPVSDLRIHS